MDATVAARPSLGRSSLLSPERNNGHSRMENSGWVAASLLESYTWDSSYSPLIDSSIDVPRSRFVEVPHVRQLWTWDCGLACVLMVLKALGIEDCDMESLAKLCSTTSIWTVDLAHLLRRFSINVSFLTVTIGANPNFARETFYKEHMAEDGERVNGLFEKAPQAGIQIQWRSISGEELSMLILSGNYIAIALVDKYKLSQPWLEELCLSDCCGVSSGYTGHYVVICGYDMETNEFEIRDPASSRESERISLWCLDEARKSFGTDEDILLEVDAVNSKHRTLSATEVSNSGERKNQPSTWFDRFQGASWEDKYMGRWQLMHPTISSYSYELDRWKQVLVMQSKVKSTSIGGNR